MDNTLVQRVAAAAFRKCRRNHAKSRAIASYLAKQMAVSQASRSEADAAMPAIDALLDKWYAERTKNPHFKPDVSTETDGSDVDENDGKEDKEDKDDEDDEDDQD